MSTFTVSMVPLNRWTLQHELLFSLAALLSFVCLKEKKLHSVIWVFFLFVLFWELGNSQFGLYPYGRSYLTGLDISLHFSLSTTRERQHDSPLRPTQHHSRF